MGYLCENCGKKFMEPIFIEVRHGLEGPWCQRYPICPFCEVAGMLEVMDDAGFPN